MKGTWQTTGGGSGSAGPMVALFILIVLGLSSGAAVRLIHAVIIAVAVAALVLVAGVTAAVVAVCRYSRRREERSELIWQSVPAVGTSVKPQVTAAQPQMIVNHYHGGSHLHLAPGDATAAIIRQALADGAVVEED